MDDLTLREKLDALEACEKLIAFYNNKLNGASRQMVEEEDEETVGYDYAAPYRDKYLYYKNLRNKLIESLEMDSVLAQASENVRAFK